MNARDTTHFPSAAHAVALIGCGPKPRTPDVPPPEAIGFKAHNLARMAAMALPVPPAFVLGTGWCADPAALRPDIWQPALAALEHASDARFGDARQPLLLSVRSGAPVSMPGMMETLLNIGLCDATLPGFLRATGNPRLVWDAYRRLVAGFGEVVLGIDAAVFEADLAQIAAGRDERELDFAELRALTRAHLASVQRVAGQPFPQSPRDQLTQAIAAVFASWQAPKARDYRRLNGIADSIGTAVTVQRMVFGNAGGTSGAGVGFTRYPSTGEPAPWVDFLFNAQGEDVVSGRRSAQGHDQLAAAAPPVWHELLAATQQLEQAFGDMRTSNSRSRTAACGCCRPAPASARRRPPRASRSTWPTRASSALTRRAAAPRAWVKTSWPCRAWSPKTVRPSRWRTPCGNTRRADC